MRELFIYYRVAQSHAEQAKAAAIGMQASLRVQHPSLYTRVLRRPEAADGFDTWMEIYSTDAGVAPAGVDGAIQASIEAAASGALHHLIAGERHTEVFIACAS